MCATISSIRSGSLINTPLYPALVSKTEGREPLSEADQSADIRGSPSKQPRQMALKVKAAPTNPHLCAEPLPSPSVPHPNTHP